MCWNLKEPKAPVCFNFFNFHPVCTKYISHEHRTYHSYSYAFFVFGTATFWRGNGKPGAKKLKISYSRIGDFMYPSGT